MCIRFQHVYFIERLQSLVAYIPPTYKKLSFGNFGDAVHGASIKQATKILGRSSRC